MRRAFLVLTTLTVAAAVIIAGMWLAQSAADLVPEKPYQQLLADWVAENSGAEVRAGWIAPLIYPGLGVQVRNLELHLKGEAAGLRPIFSAKAVKVVADKWEFLHRRKVIWREIIVDRPQVYLVRDSGGDWNFKRWLQELPKPKPSAPENDSFLRWAVKDSLRTAFPMKAKSWRDYLQLSRLEIKNAAAVFSDYRIGKKYLPGPLRLSGINLSVSGAPLTEPIQFNLSLPFPQGYGADPDGSLALNGVIRLIEGQGLNIGSLSGGWSDLRIQGLSGEVRFKPKFSFDLKASATATYPAFKALATWPPLAKSKTLPDTSGAGRWRMSVRVWGPDPAKPAKVHYQGTAELLGLTFDPGRVIAPLENVRAVITLNDGTLEMSPTTIKCGGSTIHGWGKMIEAHDPLFILHAESDYVDFQRLFPGRKKKLAPGAAMLPMRTFWEGDAQFKEAVYKKIRLQDAAGRWSVTNQRRLSFPVLSFKAAGGSYLDSGRSWVDFNHPTDVLFTADGQIRGMDVTAFSDQIFDTTTFLHGTFDADGAVTGKFVSGKFISRAFDGDLRITVHNGYFKGVNLMGSVLGFLGLTAPESLKNQQFKTLAATVRLEGGIARFTDMRLTADNLRADIKGWIDFPGQAVDLKIKLTFEGTLSRLIRQMPLAGSAMAALGESLSTVQVRATGNWGNLKYALLSAADAAAPVPPPLAEP